MREIKLTNSDQVTIVDSDMFDYLNQWAWRIQVDGYVTRWDSKKDGEKRPKLIFLHREVVNTPKGKITDHINRNRLDNRSDNLRVCNHSQNNSNTKKFSTNKSGYRGVSWNNSQEKWLAYISFDYTNYYLGSFDNKHDAASAWNAAARELKGEFASLNDIKEEV